MITRLWTPKTRGSAFIGLSRVSDQTTYDDYEGPLAIDIQPNNVIDLEWLTAYPEYYGTYFIYALLPMVNPRFPIYKRYYFPIGGYQTITDSWYVNMVEYNSKNYLLYKYIGKEGPYGIQGIQPVNLRFIDKIEAVDLNIA